MIPTLQEQIIGKSRLSHGLAVLSLLLWTQVSPVGATPANLTKIDINMPQDENGELIQSEITDNADGSFTVTAGGGDTWGNTDSFTYLYEERTGDFDIRVQVLDVLADDPSDSQQGSAKGSLHVRTSLDPDSADVMINGTPVAGANYVETIYRPAKGRGTDDPPANPAFTHLDDGPGDGTYRPKAPISLYSPADNQSTWLRLRRVRNVIQAFISTDGKAWRMLTDFTLDPAEFPETLYVGISTVAHVSPGQDLTHRVRATYANYGNTQIVPSVDGNTPVDASSGPGAYPKTSVLAANWKLAIPSDGKAPDGSFITINGSQKNQIILTSDGETTGGWTVPGYNQGDLDISLSPRDPVNAFKNLGPYSNPDRSGDVTDPNSPVTQAWIPSTRQGLVLATIRKNSQQWNDNGDGGPTPAFSAFASVSVDSSSRKGFSMDTGAFQNGEIYVSLFKLGDAEPALPAGASPFALREANIDLATVWFPFDQGWKAGYIGDANHGSGASAPPAYWAKQGSHSAEVAEDTSSIDKVSSKALFNWLDVDGGGTYGGLGHLVLPNVDPSTDGMLFTVSNDDESDNQGQFITAAPFDDGDKKGWTIAIRQDDDDYSPTTYSQPSRTEFGFVYIPYTAGNLIGGSIHGTDGSKLGSAGNFSIARIADGQYEVTIPGKTGSDGVLILQNSGWLASDSTVADDSTLSYEYTGNNKFLIQSHHVVPGGAPSGGDATVTRDTDFYFAWVDFKTPLTPVPAPVETLALQSASSVAGPYTDEASAVVNSAAKTITLAKSTSTRFYRTVGTVGPKLKSITTQNNSIVITFE